MTRSLYDRMLDPDGSPFGEIHAADSPEAKRALEDLVKTVGEDDLPAELLALRDKS